VAIPRSSVFLERQNYRRRRLIDLIKILPVIGLVLWLVPLLWRTQGEDQVLSSSAIIYIFAIWFVLVIAKFLSARALLNVTEAGKDHAERGQNGQS